MTSDCEQEQLDELESLECLYPSTFNRNQQSPNTIFTIDIYPHETDSNEPNHVAIQLHIHYPPTYPLSTIPTIKISSIKGITNKQISHLHSLAIEIATDNIGTPSMFSICTEIQEYLIQNNIPMNTSLHDEMLAKQELQKRLQRLTFCDKNKNDMSSLDIHSVQDFDKSYQRAKGTPVTKKTFAKWQKQFFVVYREKERLVNVEKYGNDTNRDMCTGKEIFEQMARERLNFEVIADMQVVGDSELCFIGDNNNVNVEQKRHKRRKKRKKNRGNSNSVSKKVVVMNDNRNRNQGQKESVNDNDVVIFSDESLFLDMEMPDI